MGMLVWVMMGLAIWHFTIFLPDRFWGGIVGAFLGALIGSSSSASIDQRLHGPRPGRHRPADGARGDPGRAASASRWCTFEGVRRERARTAARA